MSEQPSTPQLTKSEIEMLLEAMDSFRPEGNLDKSAIVAAGLAEAEGPEEFRQMVQSKFRKLQADFEATKLTQRDRKILLQAKLLQMRDSAVADQVFDNARKRTDSA